MAIILLNIGFFFWIVSFEMKKPKKTKAQIASIICYIVSAIFWITEHIIK